MEILPNFRRKYQKLYFEALKVLVIIAENLAEFPFSLSLDSSKEKNFKYILSDCLLHEASFIVKFHLILQIIKYHIYKL